MSEDPTFNRRKYPRVLTESIVSITVLEDDTTLGAAVDLSLGGIRFQMMGVELFLWQKLSICLNLGDDSRTVVGRVVRLTDEDPFTQEVAVAFLEVDSRTRELMQETLADLVE